jgi:hypothetical protein
MSHTPAPWIIDQEDPHCVLGGNSVVADSGLSTLPIGQKAANAHLIASAPEMYEALMRVNDGCRVSEDADLTSCRCVGCDIRRAIAKAEGK